MDTRPAPSRRDLKLLAEFQARYQDDPLWAWAPFPKQAPFVTAVLDGPTTENYFIDANRSGKSTVGAYCGARLARYGLEPTRPAVGPRTQVYDRATSGWVISLDFPLSRDTAQPLYFANGFGPPGVIPFIPAREIQEWRAGDQILKLKNGSLIGFKSCDSGRTKFQGAAKDWVHFDEEPPMDIYEETVIRVGAHKRLRVFVTATLLPPEGIVGGVTWLFSRVLQPWEQGTLPHVGCFGASIYDNPFIDPAEVRRLEAIYPEGSVARRIRLLGEWLPGLSGARMYAAFARRLHVRPQLWPPQPRRPLCWVWDFNVEPLATLLGQREGRLFRVLKELSLDEGSIGEMVDWFRTVVPSHAGEVWLYGDATGKRRTSQTGQSDYQLILNYLRTYGSPVRLKVPEDNPLVRDRVNAVNRALLDETGAQWVEVDPACPELIADLEQVISDGRGGIKKTFNRRDPYFRRTHASDALGYWISFEEPVRSGGLGAAAAPRPLLRAVGYAFQRR
jgi:phage terminase large subunit-like protein